MKINDGYLYKVQFLLILKLQKNGKENTIAEKVIFKKDNNC